MCGSLAGWFQVAIQAVDWFVPEHHLLDSGHQAKHRILTRAHALFQEAYARAADSTMPAGYIPKPKLQFPA